MSSDDQTYLEDKKVPIWESRKTCWVSQDKQSTQAWKDQKIGRITAGLISEICGRVNRGPKIKSRSPEELARVVCGLEPTTTLSDTELAMMDGIAGEPLVRNWYSEVIQRPINEVGLAVWKQDPFFGASLDGESTYDDNKKEVEAAVEIKIPEKFNQKFIEVYQSWGQGVSNPHPETYLFTSHYDQITAGSVITGKHGCYYVVACLKSRKCFHQYIYTDYELWNEILYPRAKAFRDRYVVPLLKEHNIPVIMPERILVKKEDEEYSSSIRKGISQKENAE
jgi:hypothetical protein